MKKSIKLFLVSMLSFFIVSCDDDTVELPDNFLAFKSTEQGLTGTDATVELTMTRAADATVPVTVLLAPTGVEYGKHFTTEPAAPNNVITLSIPQGSNTASFKVIPVAGVLLSGTESIAFSISNVTAPTLIGINKDLKLSFSKIISQGSTLTLEGKTAESNYTNNVYADLSANSTKLSNRKLWNIAFTNGSQFRVVLNSAYQTTAAVTTKSDINAVTLADTSAVQNLNFEIGNPAALPLVDFWDGDLTKTVFAEVSATAADNKVYLVSFEGAKAKNQWYKVKVDRNGTGYKVQYAKIDETAIKTVDISKNADFNLSFLSFETGEVADVEPKAKAWDLLYGYSTHNAVPNAPSPYWFQDFVSINNLAGVEAAEVLTTTVSYANYAEANIATTTFLPTRDAIGSKWRVTSGATVGVRKDRFYVIKDAEGNVYKLNFVNMGLASDGGERGKPVIEYKLVKGV
jgi:hypothetical protein